MKKFIKLTALIFLIIAAGLAFAGCRSNATVTFRCGEDVVKILEADNKGMIYEPFIVMPKGIAVEGWYDNEDFNGDKFDFEKTVVKKDVTLFARLESLEYSVLYDVGFTEDAPDAPTQASVNLNGTFTTAEAPERTGYKFTGWSDGLKIYSAGVEYTVEDTDNVVLVATWEYQTFTVRFFDDCGIEIADKTVPYGGDVTPPLSDYVPHTYPCFKQTSWNASLEKIKDDTDFYAVYSYLPTEESYFDFKINPDGNSYSIRARDTAFLPSFLALPNRYNGLKVTRVMHEGFRNGEFSCLYIPGEYSTVENSAFISCFMLDTVVIEEGLETIDVNAFGGCYNLKTIYLPASLSALEAYVFDCCDSLQNVVIASNSKNFVYEDDVIYTYGKKTIVYAVLYDIFDSYTINSEVEVIAAGAFMGKMLDEITISGDVDVIENAAFYACQLTRLNILGSVNKIHGREDFKYSESPYTILNQGAFCTSKIINLELPSGLTHIGEGAFQGCSNLKSVVIPNTVAYIGRAAFENDFLRCVLESITMDIGQLSLNGRYEITGNTIIEKGTGINGGDKFLIYAPCAVAESYVMPQGVTQIEPFAFTNLKFLKYVTICEGVEVLPYACFFANQRIIGDNFIAKSSLISVTLPSTLKKIEQNEPEFMFGGVTYWGEFGAFYNCNLLEEVILPLNSQLEYIGSYTFYNTNLTRFFVPAGVSYIGSQFIAGMSIIEINVDINNEFYCSLDGVLFNKTKTELLYYPNAKTDTVYVTPSQVEVIKDYAFLETLNLQEITLSEGVREIGIMAFALCQNLTTLYLPSTLIKISELAFYECNALETVTFLSALPPLMTGFEYREDIIINPFDMVVTDNMTGEQSFAMPASLKFYVPEQYLDAYKDAFAALSEEYSESVYPLTED